MKKFLALLTVASFMAIGTAAYAQQGNGMGAGQGYGIGAAQGDNYTCPCGMQGKGMRGHGMKGHGMHGMRGQGRQQQEAPTVTSVEQAAEIAKTAIAEKFKGYTVGDVTAHEGRRGQTGYTVEATDASGNQFVFMVNPWGQVRGPLPIDALNALQAK